MKKRNYKSSLIHVAAMLGMLSSGSIANADEVSPTQPADLSTILSKKKKSICPNQHARPDWAKDLNAKEAYKGYALKQVYTNSRYKEMITRQDCSCPVRFPSWDQADAFYQSNFLGLNFPETNERLRDLEIEREINKMHIHVLRLCRSQGHL